MKKSKKSPKKGVSGVSLALLKCLLPPCIAALCYISFYASSISANDLPFMKSGIISMLESVYASLFLVLCGAFIADSLAKRDP